MSERVMKYIVAAAFVLIAVGLFFAPAWSAADGGEGVAAAVGTGAATRLAIDRAFLGLGLLLVLAGMGVVFSQNRR